MARLDRSASALVHKNKRVKILNKRSLVRKALVELKLTNPRGFRTGLAARTMQKGTPLKRIPVDNQEVRKINVEQGTES